MEVPIRTVESGWRHVLNEFAAAGPRRVPTRHGVSFDLTALTVRVEHPTYTGPPPDYPYLQEVAEYMARLGGDRRQSSLLHRRLTVWRTADATVVDQLDSIVTLLTKVPNSRSAVFSTWDPRVDVESTFPVSPVGGSFRLVRDRLWLFLTARSVDLWVGLVPELLAFGRLQSDIAGRIGAQAGQLVYHAWSAHMYEADFVTYATGDR